jgi:DNA helicase-2/ATP-dependent DNA helicase PcrA
MFRGVNMPTAASRFLSEMPAEAITVVKVGAVYDALDSQLRDDYDQDLGQFRRGQMVRHPRFGVGRILDRSAAGGDPRVIVEFSKYGRKTLVLKYANLEAMG